MMNGGREFEVPEKVLVPFIEWFSWMDLKSRQSQEHLPDDNKHKQKWDPKSPFKRFESYNSKTSCAQKSIQSKLNRLQNKTRSHLSIIYTTSMMNRSSHRRCYVGKGILIFLRNNMEAKSRSLFPKMSHNGRVVNTPLPS